MKIIGEQRVRIGSLARKNFTDKKLPKAVGTIKFNFI